MTEKSALAAALTLPDPFAAPRRLLTHERPADLERQVRRLTLEARTLGVSLRCAIEDLAREEFPPGERSQLLLDWHDRVSSGLQDIEARRLRLVRRIEREGVGPDHWVDTIAECVRVIAAAQLVAERAGRSELRDEADKRRLTDNVG